MIKKVSLGSLMIRRKEKCGSSNSDLTVYSVTNTKGLIPSDDLHDNSIYSEDVSNYLKVYPNDFVYNPARLNIGSFARMKENKIGIVSPMYIVFSIDEGLIDAEYFELLIFKKNVFNEIVSSVEQGARFRFDYSNWNKVKVNIPSIEKQREIVKKLKVFKELDKELNNELEARRSQYEFWRVTLLTPENNEKKLEEVLKIKNGKDYKHLNEGNIPVYGTGGIMCYVDSYTYDKPTVLIPRKGSLNKIYYVDTPFWNVDTIFHTEINESVVIPKYIYYCLQEQHLEELNTAGGVPSLTQTVLNKVKIPVPPLEEQQRIVNILDKFDKLVNDISEGLPAEIEARKKQYEYYRNKLLSFEEAEVNE